MMPCEFIAKLQLTNPTILTFGTVKVYNCSGREVSIVSNTIAIDSKVVQMLVTNPSCSGRYMKIDWPAYVCEVEVIAVQAIKDKIAITWERAIKNGKSLSQVLLEFDSKDESWQLPL